VLGGWVLGIAFSKELAVHFDGVEPKEVASYREKELYG
jgi:hypothetical protein